LVWRGTPASAAGSGKQRHDAHQWVTRDVVTVWLSHRDDVMCKASTCDDAARDANGKTLTP